MARSWGGGLLVLLVVGFSQGTKVALSTALFLVLVVLLAATVGTTLSLVCRHTSIALGGTVGTLVIVFVLVPLVPRGLLYFAPSLRPLFESAVLGSMWIKPVAAVMGAINGLVPLIPLEEALLRLSCSLLGLNTLLILAAMGILARTRADDATMGTSFWERDLSRSWR